MKLEDACEIISGGTPSTSNEDYWNGEIAWATPTDITKLNGQIEISKTKRRITEKGLQHSSATILPKGSVLITTRATIGYCAINQIPISTNQGFKSLICMRGIHNYFIYYLINHLRPKLESLAGGSTFKEISRNSIGLLKIIMPSFNEQIKISDILKSIDYSLQKTQEILLVAKKLKEGLLQQLLTKGIGHTVFKETKLGRIPKEWEVVKLGDVLDDFQNGFASGKRDEKGIVQLRTNNITIDGRILLDSTLKVPIIKNIEKYLLKRDDIIFNNTNSLDLIGKTAIFTNEHDYCVFSNHLTRLRVDITKLLPYWLLYQINYSWIKNQFKRICNRHVNQVGISGEVLKNYEIPLPRLDEQKKITEILNYVDNKIRKEGYIKESFGLLKKGLMQQLLTGKIRVKV